VSGRGTRLDGAEIRRTFYGSYPKSVIGFEVV